MKRKIRYVSLEPSAFLLDLDYISMSYAERGLYDTIIFYLYENDGFISMEKLFSSSFNNCENFEQLFEKIKGKFLIKDGKISHKRVLAELKRARHFSQLQSIKGVKANEIRWKNHSHGDTPGILRGCHGDATGIPKRSEGEAKGSEDKRREEKGEAKSSEEKKVETHYASQSVSLNGSSQRLASPAPLERATPSPDEPKAGSLTGPGTIPTDFTMKLIYLNDGLCKIFPQRTPADTSSIRNLSNWVINRIRLGLFQDKIIGNILGKARDSKKGKSRKPIAVFYAQLKTDLGYKQDG
jgi:hypothetical protein